jgi:hypothetical protein
MKYISTTHIAEWIHQARPGWYIGPELVNQAVSYSLVAPGQTSKCSVAKLHEWLLLHSPAMERKRAEIRHCCFP